MRSPAKPVERLLADDVVMHRKKVFSQERSIDIHKKLAVWPTNDRYFTQFHLIFSPTSLTGVAVSAIAVSIWTGTNPKPKIGAMAKWWSSTAASQVIYGNLFLREELIESTNPLNRGTGGGLREQMCLLAIYLLRVV